MRPKSGFIAIFSVFDFLDKLVSEGLIGFRHLEDEVVEIEYYEVSAETDDDDGIEQDSR